MSADRRSHPATGDPMNLPNYITLVRIILIPFFVNLMIYGYFRAALLVFAVACVTDALDGLIARLTGQITELGAFLDPMADKLLLVTMFVMLTLPGTGAANRLPLWARIEYAPVHLPDWQQVYRFPAVATVDVETLRQHWRNVHRFTEYKRFMVGTSQAVAKTEQK